MFAACIALSVMAMVMPANLREPIAGTLRRNVVAPMLQLQKGAERWRAAYLSSERVELRRDTLALAAARVPTLESENDRLRALLGFGSKLQWGFIPAEALQGRGRAEDFTVTLSAGSNAGVREHSLVIAPEGIVGLVQTVDPTMSLVILFAHPDFRVSAISANDSAFGIVQPHVTTSSTTKEASYLRSERYLLEMRGVPFRATLKPGAIIYSSGLGGIYPKGIPVGVVLAEIKTSETWARTYLLRPAVNPTELSSVMILTPRRSAAGVANVWADLGAVDSATKQIVAAGDSLARHSASAEADARRAAIDAAAHTVADSVRRDSLARRDSTGRAPATTPGDSVARARVRADSIAAARIRRQRRDSIAAARRDTTRRDSTAGARP
jgi:rod shape-determining protein MreC